MKLSPAKEMALETGLGKEKGKANRRIRVVTTICALALVGAGAWYWWWQAKQHALPEGIAKSNGRIEAEQVEIAAKLPGRIVAILVKEGDTVQAGQVLARMDTAQLEAQLQAEQAQVVVAEHQKVQAEANIVQQDSNLTWAKQEFARHSSLSARGVESAEELDRVHNALKTAQAARDTAVAGLEAAKATIRSHQASAAAIQSLIDDSTARRSRSTA